MIPLHDDNPTTLTPVVTIATIAACALVFLWQMSLSEGEARAAVFAYGLVPSVLFGEQRLPSEIARVSAELSIVTSMFMHGGLLHIAGNMLYLWIFGNNIEDAMGHAKFVAFYLACGAAAAMAQAFSDPSSSVPMIGASGAIGGVLGGYFMLFPRAHVLVLIPLGIFTQLMRVPAVLVLGLWFLLQFLQTALTGGEGGVAYWAHIGGFVAGAILIVPLRDRRFPLFGHANGRGGPQGPWGPRGR